MKKKCHIIFESVQNHEDKHVINKVQIVPVQVIEDWNITQIVHYISFELKTENKIKKKLADFIKNSHRKYNFFDNFLRYEICLYFSRYIFAFLNKTFVTFCKKSFLQKN